MDWKVPVKVNLIQTLAKICIFTVTSNDQLYLYCILLLISKRVLDFFRSVC